MTISTTSPVSTDARPGTRTIVVGVDPSGRSVSALVWAVEEADRDRTRLHLVSARPGPGTAQDPVGQHDLGGLARRMTLSDVTTQHVVGDPVEVILRAAGDADLIAVGCRSLRPTQRMVMGSTSHAVARWAFVPVVVVPEAWMQPSMAMAPIVVGVRSPEPDTVLTDEPDREVFDFAFARAAACRVPLVVLSAWEIPTAYAWSPADIEDVRGAKVASLERRLAPWHEAFPQVRVLPRAVAETPGQALLDASTTAQLVVVGRHHGVTLSGHLGSTTRGVLRGCTRPVAVVPAGSREELARDDRDLQRVLADRPWAPMF